MSRTSMTVAVLLGAAFATAPTASGQPTPVVPGTDAGAPAPAPAPAPADDGSGAPRPSDEPTGPHTPVEARAVAMKLAGRAKGHFDRGEYRDAIADYREAYRLLPSTGLLYNLAQAYRLAGDCAGAAPLYRDYLRLEPSSPYRVTVEQNLTAAEACARQQRAAGGAATKGGTNGGAATNGGATAGGGAGAAHGHGKIATTTGGKTGETAATGAGGKDGASSPGMPGGSGHGAVGSGAPGAAVQVTAHDTGRTQRLTGLGVAGGGVLLVAAGAYFAADAASASKQVGDFYAMGGSWSDIASVDARGRRSRVIAIGSFAVGAAAVVTGAALYVLGRKTERRSIAVAPAPAPGGGQLVLWGRF